MEDVSGEEGVGALVPAEEGAGVLALAEEDAAADAPEEGGDADALKEAEEASWN